MIFRKGFKILLYLTLLQAGFWSFMPISFSQPTDISGFINNYTKVTSIDYANNSITVSNTSAFSAGDKALIIQMKGATISTSNTSSFGDISSYGNAGNYEFLTICSIVGNEITFTMTMLRTYDTSGAVQMITVPQYEDANIIAKLRATAWDGTTGGVLVLEVNDSLIFNETIDGRAKGFVGAAYYDSPFSCSWAAIQTDYYYDYTTGRGAIKGEGITAYPTGKDGGKGKLANGGGGSNDHNGGGAGGSNYGAGGNGGERIPKGAFYCSCPHPGRGGAALTYNNTANKVFMGGGGGAGHGNNAQGTGGTSGGGIVIIRAGIVVGKNKNINCNAENQTLESRNDGCGGAGGGGAILLEVDSFSTALILRVAGGWGGNANNAGADQCNGPSGGGGGGVVWISGSSLPGLVTTNLSGGVAGVTYNTTQTNCTGGSSNNATAGGSGALLTGLVIPESSAVFSGCSTLPVELGAFEAEIIDNTVKLKWITYSEFNCDYFILERSKDGEQFDELRRINGSGNSMEVIKYHTIDDHPYDDISYYRLKQVDINNNFSYSGKLRVSFSKPVEMTFKIFPNPVDNGQIINVVGPALTESQDVHTIIYDFLGRIVYHSIANYSKGKYKIEISTEGWTKGMYFVNTITDNSILREKIIVL